MYALGFIPLLASSRNSLACLSRLSRLVGCFGLAGPMSIPAKSLSCSRFSAAARARFDIRPLGESRPWSMSGQLAARLASELVVFIGVYSRPLPLVESAKLRRSCVEQ